MLKQIFIRFSRFIVDKPYHTMKKNKYLIVGLLFLIISGVIIYSVKLNILLFPTQETQFRGESEYGALTKEFLIMQEITAENEYLSAVEIVMVSSGVTYINDNTLMVLDANYKPLYIHLFTNEKMDRAQYQSFKFREKIHVGRGNKVIICLSTFTGDKESNLAVPRLPAGKIGKLSVRPVVNGDVMGTLKGPSQEFLLEGSLCMRIYESNYGFVNWFKIFLFFIAILITLLIVVAEKCRALVIYVKENQKDRITSIGLIVAIAFSMLIVVRWWYYIDTYSVNILFWDQWDLYDAFFDKKDLWGLFSWQHGPHRQGFGFIVAKVIASISGWNTRAEAFAIGGAVFFAMVAALVLRSRFSPRLTWTDVSIPLIFLTPIQYELFAGTPNLSHGAVPLLLLMLYVLVWVAWRGPVRCAAILTLNFLLIYTGFGVFVGIITPCLFGAEAIHAHRTHDQKGLWLALIGVVVSLLSAWSFFVGYQFDPAVDGFKFPINEWWRYLQFIAVMLANFCGIKGVTPVSYAFGFFILLLMIALMIIHVIRALRHRESAPEYPADAVIAVLISFTLIFCANTAIGRISLGLPSAQSSRYVTYVIPGFLGIYFWLVSLQPAVLRSFLLVTAVAGLIAASFPLREADRSTLNWYAEGKSRWKAVYLQTEDIEVATRAANFPIYPAPERTRLKQKLEYLKSERLNLYLDVPAAAVAPLQSGAPSPK